MSLHSPPSWITEKQFPDFLNLWNTKFYLPNGPPESPEQIEVPALSAQITESSMVCPDQIPWHVSTKPKFKTMSDFVRQNFYLKHSSYQYKVNIEKLVESDDRVDQFENIRIQRLSMQCLLRVFHLVPIYFKFKG